MWQRLKDYLMEVSSIYYPDLNKEEKQKIKEELLQQIAFFQHERLVHLIVTVTFALLAFVNLLVVYFTNELLFGLLELLLIALLIPYIIHYYRLENGTQELYKYYDKLTKD